MKKIIINTLLLLLAAIPAFAAEKYAVLITGCYANTHIPSEFTPNSQYEKTTDSIGTTAAWNDTYLQWEQLMKKGYKNENIYVLFADGRDFPLTSSGSWVDNRYIPMVQMSIPSITDYQATKSNVETVFNNLKNTTTTDDFLFVWTFDHGALDLNTNNSFLGLLNPTLDTLIFMADTTFARLVNPIPANKKVIQMSQCYSGGFINDLESNCTIVHTSAENRRSAHNCDDIATPGGTEIIGLENEIRSFGIGSNEKFWHTEFNFHNYNALAGETPVIGTTSYNGQLLSEADTNNDGVVSVEENKEWTRTHETQRENPQYSDLGNIGKETSLQYPTILYQDPNIPYFQNKTMSGLSAIVKTVSIAGTTNNGQTATVTIATGGDCDILDSVKVTVGGVAPLIGSLSVLSAGLNFKPNAEIIVNQSSYLNLDNATLNDGLITVKAGGILNLSNTTTLNNMTINVEQGGIVNIVGAPTIAALSKVTFSGISHLILANNSILTIEGTLNANAGSVIEGTTNSNGKIFVTGNLNINGTAINKVTLNSFSQGIIGLKSDAKININHANFTDFTTAISGLGKIMNISNSSITNCSNGINLASYPEFSIDACVVTGNNSGVGVTVKLPESFQPDNNYQL